MERNKLLFLPVIACVFAFVSSVPATDVGAFSEVQVRNALDLIPEEERSQFLRYALNYGYELVEGIDNIEMYKKISDNVYRGIYKYYIDNHLKTEKEQITSLAIICFPTGCVNVDDSAVHP